MSINPNIVAKTRNFTFSLLCLFGFLTQAQHSQFVYYDLSEAVANEVVKSLVKDQQGYIWLATDAGVLRYDGVASKMYRAPFKFDYIKGYLCTKDHQLLVINDYGIKEIKTFGDSVTFVDYFPDLVNPINGLTYPKSIYQDKSGNIWIGEISSIVRINKEGVKRFELGYDFQSISYHRTFLFQEDAFGTLWIAPFKGRLMKYDPVGDQLIPVEVDLPITEIAGFSLVNGDYLMLGGKEGIFQLKVDSDQQLLDSSFIQTVDNISALQSVGDLLFIGTWDQGMLMFDFKKKTTEKVPGVDFNDVVDFYFDATVPEVWVVGSENVGLLSFSLIQNLEPVSGSRVECVSPYQEQIYYSIGQEIRTFQYATDQPAITLLQSKNNYFDRVLAEKDIIWIGDSFGAIIKFNSREGSIKLLKDSTGNAIKHAFMDDFGNKWFSGNRASLIRIGAYDEQVYTYPIASSNVVKQAPNGIVYCGSFDDHQMSLHAYNDQKDVFTPVDLKFESAPAGGLSIEDLDFDQSGNIWMVTNHGVFKREADTGITRKMNIPDLDINESLKAIAVKDDIVWIAGSFGLYGYNGEGAIRFNTKNGLPSKLLNWRGLQPYKDGLLVSTAKGLVMIRSEMIRFEKTPGPVVQRVQISGVELENTLASIEIPYQGSIELEFTTLTYPGKEIVYQSRIQGLSDRWSEPTSNRQLSLIGFSEGNYVLEVRSREIGALWSDPVKIPFTVPIPWYRTWWAYTFMFLLGLFVITASIRGYNYHLIRQKQRFKKIIEDRTRQIDEQKNEIIAQKNRIIEQKEELLAKNESIHRSQRALSDADVNFLHLKEKQLLDQIDYKNKQITTHTLHIIQKNETLKDLRNKLELFVKSPGKVSTQDIRKIVKTIDESYRLDKDWEDFSLYFEQIYTGFYAKLKVNCPSLTTLELRHCALIRMNLTVNECATILGISPDSVKVSRSRIRKKLDMEESQGLTDFILSI